MTFQLESVKYQRGWLRIKIVPYLSFTGISISFSKFSQSNLYITPFVVFARSLSFQAITRGDPHSSSFFKNPRSTRIWKFHSVSRWNVQTWFFCENHRPFLIFSPKILSISSLMLKHDVRKFLHWSYFFFLYQVWKHHGCRLLNRGGESRRNSPRKAIFFVWHS